MTDSSRPSEGPVAYAALCALVAALAALPFLLVELPPIHDLAHHLEQARLHEQVRDAPTDAYRVAWLAPQNLVYLLLVPLWGVLSPVAAGKAFAYLLLLGTLAAVFVLAARRGRSAEAAVVASLFAFNSNFYAGFFAFQLGGALFLLWLALPDPEDRLAWAGHAALLFAVAWAHAFWFAVVGLVAVVRLVLLGGTRPRWLRLLAGAPAAAWLVPSLILVARSRAEGGFPMGVVWEPIWRRFTPTGVVDAALGGVRGGVEALVVVAVVAWLVAGARSRRGDLRAAVDREILVVAGILLAAWAASPDLIAMTLGASRRWFPYAAILTVLALPVPPASTRALRTAGAVLATALLVVTADAWRFYDRAELSGFREAMSAVPVGASLLGLGLLESRGLKGAVFFQTHAWTQITRRARPDLSFTELGAGLVLSTEPRTRPIAYPLSLRPFDVRLEDLLHFEYAMVGAPQGVHVDLEADPRLTAVTDGLPWRLYRVLPEGELGPEG